jgi:hypothetical protein
MKIGKKRHLAQSEVEKILGVQGSSVSVERALVAM